MAQKHIEKLIDIGLFILAGLFIAVLLFGTAWAAWVMVVTWLLDRDGYRLIIMATSVFWAAVGVITWLIRMHR